MAGASLETMPGGRFKRKGSFNEDDVSHILQRYTATTILILLQEVSQAVSITSKIDWKNLVRRTSTGITSPREYQMLWRHLAYREDFLDKIEDGSEPLDIDSDLEFEIEADPKPNEEILSESSLCVKVLLNSTNTDIPSANENMPGVQPEKLQTIRIPRVNNNPYPTVNEPKPNQIVPSVPGSSVDGSDSAHATAPPKKKRKQWTKEEDNELISSVQKLGENWIKIEADLKSERTPHQLQLRWNLIKKKQGGGPNQKTETKIGGASWEERKAAQETFSLAVGGFSSLRPGASTNVPSPQTNPNPNPPAVLSLSTVPEAKPSYRPLRPSDPIQPHTKLLNPTPTPNLTPPTTKPSPVPKSKPSQQPVVPMDPTPRPIGPGSVVPTPRPSGPTLTRPSGPSPAAPTRPSGPIPTGPTPRSSGPSSIRPNGPGPAGSSPRPGSSGPTRPGGPSPAGPSPRPGGPSPNSLIQAAAFAAGGRIANPSTAASLLKAAQSKNVVHIRSGGVSLSTKPIMTPHTTIGLRAPSQNSNLNNSSKNVKSVVASSNNNGNSSNNNHNNHEECEMDVMDVDKHGFIEAKREIVKVSNGDGKMVISKNVGGLIGIEKSNGNGNGNNQSVTREENKEKAGL